MAIFFNPCPFVISTPERFAASLRCRSIRARIGPSDGRGCYLIFIEILFVLLPNNGADT